MSSSKNRIEWYNEDTFLRISDELPFCDLVKWSWTCWDNISKKERVFSTWLDKSKPKSTAIWHLVRFANKQSKYFPK